jgi:hypothetical protein
VRLDENGGMGNATFVTLLILFGVARSIGDVRARVVCTTLVRNPFQVFLDHFIFFQRQKDTWGVCAV